LQNVSSSANSSEDNVYGEERTLNKVLLIAVTSNRGLCGAFNANIIKKTRQLMVEEYSDIHKNGNVDVMTVGKKASETFSKMGERHVSSYDQFWDDLSFETIYPLAEDLLTKFKNKDYDRVIVVYNMFKNAATQLVTAEQLLPVLQTEKTEGVTESNYLFEPSKEEILGSLVPSILMVQFYKTLLDSFASEHGARMTAMQQATDNAQEMLRDLKLKYNKARQTAITGEILEIVGGAEALKNA